MNPLVACLVLVVLCCPYSSMAQLSWERLGPNGATITCMFTEGETVYAGTSTGKLFRKSGGTDTWEPMEVSGQRGEIVVGWARSPILIATTWNYRYRSTDDGRTWVSEEVDYRLDGLPIVPCGSRLYIGDTYSTDDGQSWTTTTQGNALYSVGMALFVNESERLRRSTDDGNTWTTVLQQQVKHMTGTADNLFAVNENGTVYHSADGGDSWREETGESDIRITSLASAGTVLYGCAGATGKIYRRTFDAPWTLRDGSGFARTICSVGTTLYAGTLLQVVRTDDGGEHWSALVHGLQDVGVYSLCNHRGTLFIGLATAVYRTTDLGRTWSDRLLRHGRGRDFFIDNTGPFLTASDPSGNTAVSTDAGDSWNAWSQVTGASKQLFMPPVLHKGSWYVGEHEGNVYRAEESASTWERCSHVDDIFGLNNIFSVGNAMFAFGIPSGLFRCTDDGRTWTDALAGLEPDVMASSRHVVDQTLYIGTRGHGVLMTSDEGGTWTSLRNGLPDSCWVVDVASVGERLYAVVKPNDVYVYTPAGMWQKEDVPPDVRMINRILECGGWLVFGTEADGLYRARPSASSVSDAPIVQHVYPQPGSSYVYVGGMACTDQAAVVYDMSGRSAFIPCEPTPTGIRLDVSGLAPGVWMVRGASASAEAGVRIVVE